MSLDTEIAFDTETSRSENITIKGAKAIYYITDNNVGTIIYNDGNYIYDIHGNISKQTAYTAIKWVCKPILVCDTF